VPTARGVQVLKLGAQAAALLATLDGSRTEAELERLHPGVGLALTRFAEAGLLA